MSLCYTKYKKDVDLCRIWGEITVKMETQKVKKYSIRVGLGILGLCVLLLMSMTFFTKVTSNILKVHFYPATADGIDPNISKNALVVSLVNHQIDVGQSITFEAERFGKDVTLTQDVVKVYTMKTGESYYKTSNHNNDNPEEYLVKEDKVVGKYLFSIPFLGNLMLFIQSKYMLLLILCIIQFFLFKKLRKYDKKELLKLKKPKRQYIMIKNMCIEHVDDEMIISGVIENRLGQTVKCVIAQLQLYDEDGNIFVDEEWNIITEKVLYTGQSVKFGYKLKYIDNVVDYSLRIRKYKN